MEFRRITPDDAEFISAVRNGVASEFLHDSQTFTPEQTREWIEGTMPDFWIIGIEGVPAGYFRLSNHSAKNGNMYVGADIREDLRGNGVGYEAYRLFLPMVFRMYNLHKVTLEVLSTNERAISLYRKLGFVTEGVKRQEVLKKDGYIDSVIMSLLKSEMNKLPDIYS